MSGDCGDAGLPPVGTHAPLRYGCAPSTKHSSGPIHKALSRWFCRRRPLIDRKGAAAPKVGHLGEMPLPGAPAPVLRRILNERPLFSQEQRW